jgi:hypothetical protein
MALLSHFQTLIFIAANYFSTIDRLIRSLYLRFSFEKSAIYLFLLMFFCLGLVIAIFGDGLFSKLNSYFLPGVEVEDFLRICLLFCTASVLLRKKLWLIFFMFFRALPLPPSGGCGSGASGLPAPCLLRCARVCALRAHPIAP